MSSETTNDSNNKPSSSSDPNRSIELSIKSLEQQVKMVSVPRNASVLDLKHKIEVLFDVDSIRQRLIFQGKVLKDDKNLMDYENLDDGKVIHLVIRPLNAPHNPENDEPQQQRNNRRPTGRRGISSGYAVITLDATLADLTGGLGATSGSLLPSLFNNLQQNNTNSPFSPSGRTASPRSGFLQILTSNNNNSNSSNNNNDRSFRRTRLTTGLDGIIDLMENANRNTTPSSLNTRLARTLAYTREINNLLDTPLNEFEHSNSTMLSLRPTLSAIHESRQVLLQQPNPASQLALVFDQIANLFERLSSYFRDLSQQLSRAEEMSNQHAHLLRAARVIQIISLSQHFLAAALVNVDAQNLNAATNTTTTNTNTNNTTGGTSANTSTSTEEESNKRKREQSDEAESSSSSKKRQ